MCHPLVVGRKKAKKEPSAESLLRSAKASATRASKRAERLRRAEHVRIETPEPGKRAAPARRFGHELRS